MKPYLHLLFSLMFFGFASAQITTPTIKANFGVDADLRANYFNSSLTFFGDDWFKSGSFGNDAFIIDTTGAAAIVSRYNTDLAFRRQPFSRRMAYPQFSVVNNSLLLDAMFVREYHGDDSTVFASGSSKNAMSPADWSCPISQQIPDKNDILDLFVHLRRAGSNATDSLWMFGGISIENTTGNRYFDFEMFQTDLTYDRRSQRFYNYGPDAGHTAWQFDGAGNIVKAGDIIFTAEYSSSSLSFIEVRIWINKADLAKSPASFNWGGQFDGAAASSQFGYASIQPKTAGGFYTGLQSADNVWAGPFGLIREDNSLVTNYMARQFMEFSVNLSKLGLDPISTLGGTVCNMPFKRILVKSRASTSFTAELKDFVAPFDIFQVPAAQAFADVPFFCGPFGVSDIKVTNPVATSTYTWFTPDGHIIGSNNGTSITVDRPGMYIVTQQLLSGCGAYAKDTVFIYSDMTCDVLGNEAYNFKAQINNGLLVKLSWDKIPGSEAIYFEVERSIDGRNYETIKKVLPGEFERNKYEITDDVKNIAATNFFYRLKIATAGSSFNYTKVVHLDATAYQPLQVKIYPNPAVKFLNISISSPSFQQGILLITNASGITMYNKALTLKKGANQEQLHINNWPAGTYIINTILPTQTRQQKIIIGNNTMPAAILK